MNNNTNRPQTLQVCETLCGRLSTVVAEYSGSQSELLEQAQDFGKYANTEFHYYIVYSDGTSSARITSYAALLSMLEGGTES